MRVIRSIAASLSFRRVLRREQFLLERDRLREQNVVFKMDVPMEIFFKLPEFLERDAIGGTGVIRRNVVVGQGSDLGKLVSRSLMFFLHHLNGIASRRGATETPHRPALPSQSA